MYGGEERGPGAMRWEERAGPFEGPEQPGRQRGGGSRLEVRISMGRGSEVRENNSLRNNEGLAFILVSPMDAPGRSKR